MVTIKENRTGRIVKVGRQFANVFIRLGTHTKVEVAATNPTRKVAAETVIDKKIDATVCAELDTETKPKRKYTRRKKQTEADS